VFRRDATGAERWWEEKMSSKYRLLTLRVLGAAATLLFVVGLSASKAQAQLVTFLDTVFTGGSEQEAPRRGVIDSTVPNFMGPGRGLADDGNEFFFLTDPTHFDVEVPMPVGGTASKFFVTVECLDSEDVGFSSATGFRFDVLRDGFTTGITCNATGPATGAAPHNVSCSDSTHTAGFDEGENLSIRVEGLPQPAIPVVLGIAPFDGVSPPDGDSCRVSGWSLDYAATF
jgi:hypothetical protein